jgi:hypothetical protein
MYGHLLHEIMRFGQKIKSINYSSWKNAILGEKGRDN